jgi:uncharacterized membrane protein
MTTDEREGVLKAAIFLVLVTLATIIAALLLSQ